MNLKQKTVTIKSIQVFIKQGFLQAVYAIILVVALIWGLTQIAIYNSEKAKTINYKSTEHNIVLKVYNANVKGALKFEPMVLENQKQDFSYMYGRELSEERKNRVVTSWNDSEASLSWFVNFDEKVSLKLEIIGAQSTYENDIVKLYLNNNLLSLKKEKYFDKNGISEILYYTDLVIETAGIYRLELKVDDASRKEEFKFKSISLKFNN